MYKALTLLIFWIYKPYYTAGISFLFGKSVAFISCCRRRFKYALFKLKVEVTGFMDGLVYRVSAYLWSEEGRSRSNYRGLLDISVSNSRLLRCWRSLHPPWRSPERTWTRQKWAAPVAGARAIPADSPRSYVLPAPFQELASIREAPSSQPELYQPYFNWYGSKPWFTALPPPSVHTAELKPVKYVLSLLFISKLIDLAALLRKIWSGV